DTLTQGIVQVVKGSLPHGWLLRTSPPDPLSLRGEGEEVASETGGASDAEGPGSPSPRKEGGPGGEVILLHTGAKVSGFVTQRRALRQPAADRSRLIADLTPGDYVVHLEHGIARFAGMVVRDVEGVQKEFLELSYAQGDRLFVPVEQSDRVA